MLHACGHLHGQGKTTFGQQIVKASIGYLRRLKLDIQNKAPARVTELMAMLPRLLCSINLHLNIDSLKEPPSPKTETGDERLARFCSSRVPMTSKCRTAMCVVNIIGEHCTWRTFKRVPNGPTATPPATLAG